MPIGNPRWLPPQVIVLTQDHMGKLLHWLNLNCASIIRRSFTNFVFFMLIVIPRWLPLQDIVFTYDQLVLFITRWTIQSLESLWFIFGILVGHDLSMRLLYRFHGWLIFARVIALFMFVWPYVRSHILCKQLVICLCHILFIFGIFIGHDLSLRILYRFHGWLIFARVIALFMFVWPYVRPHILCTQLVICHLSHFIHILYLGWPWSEHAHILPISRMVDFCESYSPFHVC